MTRLVLIGLCCLLFNSCSDASDTHRRSYVISKSQLQTEEEAESPDSEVGMEYNED